MKKILSAMLVVIVASLASLPAATADVDPRAIVSQTVAEDLVFQYPKPFEPAVAKLEREAPKILSALRQQLQIDNLDDIEVWVLPEVDDYFELHELESRPPRWAIGLSFSDKGVIIVVNGAGPNGELVDLVDTFEHELAHVAIDRARAGHHVPRWFNEGFALMHADEWTPERSETLSRAAAAGALKSFSELDRSFPPHNNSASLAYAQSYHFVRDLGTRHGKEVYAEILARVRGGEAFADAFRIVTGESIALSEAKWKQKLEEGASIWSIFTDHVAIFFGASLLFVVAWLIRRSRRKRQLARMDDEVPAGWDYDESRYPLPGD